MSEDQILAALTNLGDQMERMEGRLNDRIQAVETGLGSLGDRIDKIETGLGSLGDRIDKVETGLASLSARIAEVETGLNSLGARIDAVAAGLGARIDKVAFDLTDRIGRLQDNITSIRDDIAVTYATANNSRGLNDNTREDVKHLANQVNVMYLRIKQIEARIREITGDP